MDHSPGIPGAETTARRRSIKPVARTQLLLCTADACASTIISCLTEIGNPLNMPSSNASDDTLITELAQLLVTALNLEIAPEEINPDEPLYGDGLGLDSIDILEVALAVSKQYGFQLRADDENNKAIYASLRALAAHVATNRDA